MSEEANQRSTRYGRLSGLRPDALMAQGIPQPVSDDQGTLVIAGFEVQELIGRGGMGSVYLARQVGLDRPVAIKRVAGDFQNDPLLLDRLELEAQTMAKLQHPNIVTVHQFEKLEDGGAAIVMEYIVGGNLRDLIDAHPEGLPIEEARRLIGEIASALSAAHDSGVVHRDMKPENVLIDHDSVARVTDFGLAVPLDQDAPRLTLTGTTVGTVDYLAPERLEPNNTPDTRCDTFALGVISYELLTGKTPRGSFASPHQVRPEVPISLSDATMKALRPNPDERFASMNEFIRALDQAVKGSLFGRSRMIAMIVICSLLALSIWIFQQSKESSDAASVDSPPVKAGWQDLLTDATFDSNVIHGKWRREGSNLVSDDTNCILVLTDRVTQNYELRMTFTRLSGPYSVAVFIKANESIGTISLDSWGKGLNGVQEIGNKNLKQTNGFRFTWVNNRQYELRARVAGSRISIWIDGEKVEEVDIGENLLGVVSPWEWNPDEQEVGLAIGSWQSPTRFESFKWRPIEPDPSGQ